MHASCATFTQSPYGITRDTWNNIWIKSKYILGFEFDDF